MRGAGRAMENLSRPIGIDVQLKDRGAFWTEGAFIVWASWVAFDVDLRGELPVARHRHEEVNMSGPAAGAAQLVEQALSCAARRHAVAYRNKAPELIASIHVRHDAAPQVEGALRLVKVGVIAP